MAWLTAGVALVALAADNGPNPGMVLVPAAQFKMGSTGKAIDEDPAEAPIHDQSVAAFYLDVNEVTGAQYAAFLNATKQTKDATGHPLLGEGEYQPLVLANGTWTPKPGWDKRPMVDVTWWGAQAFAAWAGKRLPTEAEWELAARGTDGRKFPWGNTMDFSRFRLGADNMEPVGSHPTGVSPSGCQDMSGNAWEWTSSLFAFYPYSATDGREDPTATGFRSVRGGSWNIFGGSGGNIRIDTRYKLDPVYFGAYVGFRCALTK